MTTTQSRETGAAETVPVWDLFVRVFHWAVVAGFLVAYVTEGEPMWLHVWSGYLVGALVVLRVVWGVVGPRRARFSDFVYGPKAALRYLGDLVRGRARRYLGHSPAGGAMVLALLLALALTVAAGLAAYAVQDRAGPLAGYAELLGAPPAGQAQPAEQAQPPAAAPSEEGDEEGRRRGPRGVWAELHELFVNLTLILVILHILGVVIASLAHRENLARAMWTGRKRP